MILRHGFAQRSRARAHRRRRRNEAALLTVSAPLEAGRDVHQVAMRHRCLSPISRHALCWDRAHRRSVRSDVLSRRHGGGDVRLDVHGSSSQGRSPSPSSHRTGLVDHTSGSSGVRPGRATSARPVPIGLAGWGGVAATTPTAIPAALRTRRWDMHGATRSYDSSPSPSCG